MDSPTLSPTSSAQYESLLPQNDAIPAPKRRVVLGAFGVLALVGLVAVATVAVVGQPSIFSSGSHSLRAVSGTKTRYTILHTTDIHGWIMGHRHQKQLDADLGDYASLLTHMKKNKEAAGENFLAVDSGDLVDGTGLSDSTDTHGENVLPLIEQLKEIDLLTIGNHELYKSNDKTLTLLEQKYIPMWNADKDAPKVLTTNLFYKGTKETVGAAFRVHTTNTGDKIGMFGFTFVEAVQANPKVKSEMISTIVKSDEFKSYMAGCKADMYLVSIHLDAEDSGVKALHKAIQSISGDKVPIVIMTGHYHMKKFVPFDGGSVEATTRRGFAIESGRYFQVVGKLTFELDKSAGQLNDFHFEWVDTSRKNFYELAEKKDESDFLTAQGKAMKKTMKKAFDDLGLSKKFGCSDRTYSPYVDMGTPDSLYDLILRKVFPGVVYDTTRKNKQESFMNRFSFRSNLYEGEVLYDDILSLVPFPNSFFVLEDISGKDANHLLDYMEKKGKKKPDDQPHYRRLEWDDNETYDLVHMSYEHTALEAVLPKVFPEKQFKMSEYKTGDCDNGIQPCVEAYIEKYMKC